MDELKGKVVRKSQFIGVGALVQFIGVVLFVLLIFCGGLAGGVVGFILMMIFLLIGSRMSLRYTCSQCGNPVADQHVKLCPTCKAHLA